MIVQGWRPMRVALSRRRGDDLPPSGIERGAILPRLRSHFGSSLPTGPLRSARGPPRGLGRGYLATGSGLSPDRRGRLKARCEPVLLSLACCSRASMGGDGMDSAPWRDRADAGWRSVWSSHNRAGKPKKPYKWDKRPYTVCSCGQWAYNNILAKRGHCIRCGKPQLPDAPTPKPARGAADGDSKDKELLVTLRKAAALLPAGQGEQLLQQYVPQPVQPVSVLPEAQYQRAEANKRAAAKHLQAMLDARVRLQAQVLEAERKIEEALERQQEAEEQVAAAARDIAARALPPEPPRNVLHLDSILSEGAAANIQLVLGDDLDLDGPEFTKEDREGFCAFRDKQLQEVNKLLATAFGGLKVQAEQYRKEYQDRVAGLRKKRKGAAGEARSVPPQATGDDAGTGSGGPAAARDDAAPAHSGTAASSVGGAEASRDSDPAESEQAALREQYKRAAEARVAAKRAKDGLESG